jgi:ribokinase
MALSGESSADAAARRLAELASTVVVTLGPRGAMALIEGERVDAPAFDAGPPVDATGAGDLLVAAYIWADQNGAEPEDRLRWAVIYAALSITTPTAVGGAARLERLLEAGASVGLSAPKGVSTATG